MLGLYLEKLSYPQAFTAPLIPLRTITRSVCQTIGMTRCRLRTVSVGLSPFTLSLSLSHPAESLQAG